MTTLVERARALEGRIRDFLGGEEVRQYVTELSERKRQLDGHVEAAHAMADSIPIFKRHKLLNEAVQHLAVSDALLKVGRARENFAKEPRRVLKPNGYPAKAVEEELAQAKAVLKAAWRKLCMNEQFPATKDLLQSDPVASALLATGDTLHRELQTCAECLPHEEMTIERALKARGELDNIVRQLEIYLPDETLRNLLAQLGRDGISLEKVLSHKGLLGWLGQGGRAKQFKVVGLIATNYRM